jgi:catechol 2,3-dioxygenase-like lactoylglutathione lyase family enzyme
MTVQRMDSVGIVVEDLAPVVAFFTELGLELQGQMTVEGDWADRVVGLQGVRVDIVMLRTRGGQNGLELMRFQHPKPVAVAPKHAPSNALGIRRLQFAVDDLDGVLARLREHGAELVGEVAQYEDMYRLCYLRGPEGIIVSLAQALR